MQKLVWAIKLCIDFVEMGTNNEALLNFKNAFNIYTSTD